MPSLHSVAPLRGLIETIAVGAAGGLALTSAGVPAGWLCGAALSVAVLALAGRPMEMPNRLRDAIFIVLGTSMGSALTPKTLDDIQLWPMSFVILLVSVAVTMAVGAWYLRRFHGWDDATARLSSTPGALSAVLILATGTRANFPVVALSQTLRQFVLISLVPVAMMMGTPAVVALPQSTAGPFDMLLMLAGGIAGSWVAMRLKVPGGRLIGAMLASSALHVLGYVDGRLAPSLLTAAYVLMGCVIGSRFRGTSLSTLRAKLLPALGCIFVTVGFSIAFALLCQHLLGLPFAEIWLAYAPGGVEAMTVMAYALNLEPSYVSAHHVIRLLALVLLSPLWTAAIMRPPAEKTT